MFCVYHRHLLEIAHFILLFRSATGIGEGVLASGGQCGTCIRLAEYRDGASSYRIVLSSGDTRIIPRLYLVRLGLPT